MAQALLWWALLMLMGWATFPLAWRIVKTTDIAFALAHIVGLALTTWVVWFFTVLSPLPFSRVTILVILGFSLSASLWVWFREKSLLQQIKQSWPSLLVVEILFAISFAACLAFRANLPAAAHTEQPMDMAMLGSLLRSTAMPPNDPWLSGHTVNYYYGGYLQIALVAKAIGANAGTAYNVGLAQTFSLAVISLYGLIKQLLPSSKLKGKNALAVAGSLSIMLAGNLASLLQLAESIALFPTAVMDWLSLPTIGSTGEYWWFSASRIAQDTNVFGRLTTLITEFPSFGFILGDLHPHLIDLPLFTAGLTLCLILGTREEHSPQVLLRKTGFWVTAILLALVAFTNSWDLPTLLIVYAIASLLKERQVHSFWNALWQTARSCVLLATTALILALPFFLRFQAPTSGIDVSYYAFSNIALYVLMFGIWLLPIACLFIKRRTVPLNDKLALALGILGVLILGILLFGGWGNILLSLVGMANGGLLWVVLLICLTPLLAFILRPHSADGNDALRILLITALAISLFAEWFYLRDSFNTRMNTLFKIYEQVWIILGVVGIAALARLIEKRGWKRLLGWVSVTLMLLSCAYTWQAVNTRITQEGITPAIDGIAWLKDSNEQVYAAITWLNEHAVKEDVLIEGWGDEYAANESRFATMTGVPSVMGWYGHEVQWRGQTTELVQRKSDIDTFYKSQATAQELQGIIEAYSLDWIIYGPAEKQQYNLSELNPHLTEVAQIAFANDQVIILRTTE